MSMDGKIWTDVATITNWADSPDSKMVVFDEVIKSQYVKLLATENYGDGRDFITAAMINLFEDITQEEENETLPDEEEKPGEMPDETLLENPDEEQNPEEIPDETLIPEEEQKAEETLIQDQGKISNANEPDITVKEETLPKTGWNKIIAIIIVVAGILISIFYINKKRNPFRNFKN